MALTQEEFDEKIRAAFDKHDTNGNGALEREEAKALAMKMAEAQGLDFNEEKFNAMFDAADKNADGRLSFEELKKHAEAKAREKGILA